MMVAATEEGSVIGRLVVTANHTEPEMHFASSFKYDTKKHEREGSVSQRWVAKKDKP